MKSVKPAARNFIAEWAVTIILLLFATTTGLQAFVIPTGSMEDSLLVGDHLLVDKLVYAPLDAITRHVLPYHDVQRGDIIVFRYPLDIKITYVKRAIGVPGDHLRLVNKRLILNGKPTDEPYAHHLFGYDPYRDDFPTGPSLSSLRPSAEAMLANNVVNGELVVPPGFIFAMGDNRENSDDSRYWGLVPRENIMGTPLIIYWSFDAPSGDFNSAVDMRHMVDIGEHFFSKTRWERTMRLVRAYPLQR